MGFCNCSMFCCALPYVHSNFAIILMGKRRLVTLLSLSSCCLVVVVWLFLTVPWVSLQFVIVVFPDHTHLLFLSIDETVRAWCCGYSRAHRGLAVGSLLHRYSVVYTVESLSLFYILFISRFVVTMR